MGQVVPSGIDPADFVSKPSLGYFREQYPILKEKTVLLFLGRMDMHQKGLDMMIPAFAKARHTNPQLHLVLAGPNEDDSAMQLHHLIHEHGLVDNITMTGLITGKDKLAALQDADAFVLPSRFEGLSISLLEALYAGLPILATNTVGLSEEIARSGSGIIIERNVDTMTSALLKLGDADIRATMRGRGTDLILQNYTWNAIASNFVQSIQPALHTS